MTEFSIGIEDHYAWANLVSVTTAGRDEFLLDKRRVELLDHGLPASPYHHEALKLPIAATDRLVREVRASADRRALSALSSLLGELAPAKCRAIAIRVPPLDAVPTDIEEVRANAWIRNRADGMIYHQALTQAAAELNLNVFHFEKEEVLELAARSLGKPVRELERELKAFGKTVGPPWRRGHIVACAGAILAHESSARSRSKRSRRRPG